MGSICIKVVDITTLNVDAIVNAANPHLAEGGGVCGAIFSAAGSAELAKECRKYHGCSTGSAVITSGCNLKAKYIIHAVGPVWHGGKHGEADLLLSCYTQSLQLAKKNNCHSIAFPVISSGIYGYPKPEAWRMGLSACIAFFSASREWDMHVTFAVLNEENRRIGIAILENIFKQSLVYSDEIIKICQIDNETYADEKQADEAYADETHAVENHEKEFPLKDTRKKWDKLRNPELVAVFEDTIHHCETNPFLQAETAKMQAKTMLYLSDYEAAVKKEKSSGKNNIEVSEITTYAVAGKYRGEGKVAVLNFANAIHPGGGVTHGAYAQEEGLCRSSNLYLGLNRPYLKKHYYDYNEQQGSDMGSDSVIYTPGVTVFKTDADLPELLPEEEWYQTDVITCAAPRFRDPSKIIEHKLYNLHVKRGKNILETAIANDVDIIVLGAFGCGAFHNTPETVAKAYKELLIDRKYARYFKKVVFAIKHDQNDKYGNYEIFRRIMGSAD